MDERTTDPPPADASAPQPPVPRIGDDGKPVYDQEFFLALARCGKDVWNRWSAANEKTAVTFSGHDFAINSEKIDFSGFIFGGETTFASCKFGKDLTLDEWDRGSLSFVPGRARFTGAIFKSKVYLYNAEFGDGVDFSEAEFFATAYFSRSIFGRKVSFMKAKFHQDCNFSNTMFDWSARFSEALFDGFASFSTAAFKSTNEWVAARFDRANFTNSIFASGPRFSKASFARANFEGAIIGSGASFAHATFRGDARFDGYSIEQWWREFDTSMVYWDDKDREQHRSRLVPLVEASSGPGEFRSLDFEDATFLKAAVFSGRIFEKNADFSGVVFKEPPEFARCEGIENIDFYGTEVGFSGWLGTRWTADTTIPTRLRALRKHAEDSKNHDFERDLYIAERQAERGVILAYRIRHGWKNLLAAPIRVTSVWTSVLSALLTPILAIRAVLGGLARILIHMGWILVMFGYWLIADYGRSFARPLLALIASLPVAWWSYSQVLVPPRQVGTPESIQRVATFDAAMQAFAISNAVPFVGPLTLERDVKLTLLCGDRPIDAQHAQASGQPVCVPIPGRRFQLLALAQSIFSALCIFFAGLALRNYFKLR
jgi:uncharacterized protein YjbI with pentapeptide repeats